MKTFIKNLFLKILFSGLLVSGIISCEKKGEPQHPEDKFQENTLPNENSESKVEKEIPLLLTYQLDSIETASEVDSFMVNFSETEQQFIFALNRMDARRLNAGDKIIIPDTLTQNFLDYSPFPQHFEMLDSIPKTVLISRRVQGFALYEQGNLIRWGPVSSGKRSTQTPAGLFYGNYKARSKVSTVDDSWLLPYYFNFMNFEGVGVHQYAMPGYPASHACVRLKKEDAMAIYNWADQWTLDSKGREVIKNGTPFMVFGDYDFEGALPWLSLAENPQSNFLTSGEMQTLREYVTAYKNDKRNFDPPAVPEEQLIMPARNGIETLR